MNLSDKAGNSTKFIEFMLAQLNEALEELLPMQHPSLSVTDRIQIFKKVIGSTVFSRQDYLRNFKEISPATASRDLKDGVEKGILKKAGDKRMTKYRYN